MSSTDTPTTFAELAAAVLRTVKEPTTVTALLTKAKSLLNEANQDLHRERQWWAERNSREGGDIRTHAQYTTGTVAIALSARGTVTGTDTLWNTAVTGMGFNNARAGGKMVFAGDPSVYRVFTVNSDTSITLVSGIVGDTALSGAAYTYFEDEYALPSDFDDEHGLVDAISFYDNREIRLLPSSEFYRLYPRNSLPGASIRAATIIMRGPTSGDLTRRPRVVFAPPPSVQRAIPYRYYTKNLAITAAGGDLQQMASDSDEPIVPLKWRYALVFHAAGRWKGDFHDDARSQELKGRYDEMLLRARQSHDAADNRPALVPRAATGYRAFARRPWQSGRFDGGAYFDELRDRNG